MKQRPKFQKESTEVKEVGSVKMGKMRFTAQDPLGFEDMET